MAPNAVATTVLTAGVRVEEAWGAMEVIVVEVVSEVVVDFRGGGRRR